MLCTSISLGLLVFIRMIIYYRLEKMPLLKRLRELKTKLNNYSINYKKKKRKPVSNFHVALQVQLSYAMALVKCATVAHTFVKLYACKSLVRSSECNFVQSII